VVLAGACTDLFHGTSFDSACTADAEACAIVLDSTCAPTPAEGFAKAQRVCALLGACAGPLGSNAFGPCMEATLSAYDCSFRPSLPNRGVRDTFFRCMRDAETLRTCDAVLGCVYPSGIQRCNNAGAAFVGCQDHGDNKYTRYVCPEGGGTPLAGESCTLSGTACRDIGGTAVCANTDKTTCQGSLCSGTVYVECTDGGITRSTDCAFFGAGTCSSAGCTTADAGSCVADASAITCTGSQASRCVDGQNDLVDCGRLGSTCHPSTAGAAAHDVPTACESATPCQPDRCDGAHVSSCAHGVAFNVDCTQIGFTGCRVEMLPGEDQPRARCTP
jgi:hypothetical protein